jgi:hypothetical protein
VNELKTTYVFVGAAIMASYASARPEPNAFLNKTAPNLTAILYQVKTDQEVFNRYQRHFGMTKPELVSYLGTLKPSKIVKPGPYVVYNVREDGVVRSRLFNLQAGSLIYIDAMGTPVLKKVCGNPMIPGPKKLTAVNLFHEAPLAPPVDLKPAEETAPTAETPSELMVAEELAMPPVEAVPPVTPPITPPVAPPTPPVTPEVKPSFEVGDFGGALLPLLSGGLIGLIGGGGGGSTVIPEPATIGMTAMLLGLYGMRRKRKNLS